MRGRPPGLAEGSRGEKALPLAVAEVARIRDGWHRGPPVRLPLLQTLKERLNLAGYHLKTSMSECLAREQVVPDSYYRRVA